MVSNAPIVFMLSAALSVFYGFFLTYRPVSALRSAVKTGAVLTLVVFAYLSGAPNLLLMALLLCAAGDYFLSRDGEKVFLAGMGAFIAGHLLYIPLFLDFGANFQTLLHNKAFAIVLVLLGLFMATALWRKTGNLRAPVMGYVVVVLTMTLTAFALPDLFSLRFTMIGAALFAASDMILSLEMFVLPEKSVWRKVTPAVVWWSYWGAQVLILAGLLGSLSILP